MSHPTCSYRPPPSTRSFSNVLHTDCTSTPLPLCPLYFIAGLILVRLPTAGLDPVTPHPCSIIPFRSHPGRCTFPCCDCHLDLSYCSYHNILHRQKKHATRCRNPIPVFLRLDILHPMVLVPPFAILSTNPLFLTPSFPIVAYRVLQKFRVGAESREPASLRAFFFPNRFPIRSSGFSRSCPLTLLGFGLLVRVLSIHVLVAILLFLSSLPASCFALPFLGSSLPVRIACLYHHPTIPGLCL